MVDAPLRSRRDGWTPAAQAAFLAALTAGSSIAAAAAAAGMSRHSAYRLRRRSPAVAAAWAGRTAPVADGDDLFMQIEHAVEARVTASLASAANARGGADAWLIRQIRAVDRRARRRAAYGGRSVSACHLPAGDGPESRGADGRFAMRKPGRSVTFVSPFTGVAREKPVEV